MSSRDDHAIGPTVVATATSTGVFGSGRPVSVLLHVHEATGGKPMGPEAFHLEHTKTIHALAVDPSLTDYSHGHPQFTGQAGTWAYAFTPRHDRVYHVWLDVTPVGRTQQYVMLTLNEHGAKVPVDTTATSSAAVGHLTATLAFDGPLVAGQPAMGHVTIQRDGKPFDALEPVMGAYAHIVGIAQDWRTIAHVHPLGPEPASSAARGGPRIDFHLEPEKSGFLKLFAQIQVDGRDVYLPFGVTVQPAIHPGAAQ